MTDQQEVCNEYESVGICLKGFRCEKVHQSTVEPTMRSLANALLGNLYGLREELFQLSHLVSSLSQRVDRLESSVKDIDKSTDLRGVEDRMKKMSLDLIVMKGSTNTNTHILGHLSTNLKKIGVSTIRTESSNIQRLKSNTPQIPDRLSGPADGKYPQDAVSTCHYIPVSLDHGSYMEASSNVTVRSVLTPPLLLSGTPGAHVEGSLDPIPEDKEIPGRRHLINAADSEGFKENTVDQPTRTTVSYKSSPGRVFRKSTGLNKTISQPPAKVAPPMTKRGTGRTLKSNK